MQILVLGLLKAKQQSRALLTTEEEEDNGHSMFEVSGSSLRYEGGSGSSENGEVLVPSESGLY